MGRWWQIDPLADEADFTSLTPYNYSFNNPIRYNDPYGDCPCLIPLIPIILEAVVVVTEGAMVVAGTTAGVALGKAALEKSPNATGVGYSPAVGMAMSTSSPGELTSFFNSESKDKSKEESKSEDSKDVSTKKDRQKAETKLEKAENQLKGIEKAQEAAKKQAPPGQKQTKINSTKKSEQRAETERKKIKTLDDAKE